MSTCEWSLRIWIQSESDDDDDDDGLDVKSESFNRIGLEQSLESLKRDSRIKNQWIDSGQGTWLYFLLIRTSLKSSKKGKKKKKVIFGFELKYDHGCFKIQKKTHSNWYVNCLNWIYLSKINLSSQTRVETRLLISISSTEAHNLNHQLSDGCLTYLHPQSYSRAVFRSGLDGHGGVIRPPL